MMFSIGFAYCWFCQLPETRNNIYAIKHQFRHIFGKVHLQVKLETEYSKEICITNLWSCDFRKEVYKGMRCLYKKNNFIVPLYGQGSTASRLYGHYKETIYFLPQVPRNLWYSIDQPLKEENLSKIRVKILWFRTRYHWIGNPVT